MHGTERVVAVFGLHVIAYNLIRLGNLLRPARRGAGPTVRRLSRRRMRWACRSVSAVHCTVGLCSSSDGSATVTRGEGASMVATSSSTTSCSAASRRPIWGMARGDQPSVSTASAPWTAFGSVLLRKSNGRLLRGLRGPAAYGSRGSGFQNHGRHAGINLMRNVP